MKYHRHSAAVLRSARWRALRFQILERDGFACVQCGAHGRLEVDHITPVRSAPDRAFDPDNLQTLCRVCHGAKTRAELGRSAPDPNRAAWRKAIRAMEKQSA